MSEQKTRYKYAPKSGMIYRFGYKGRFKKFEGATKGSVDSKGYRYITIKNKHVRVHRLIFEIMGIEIPDGAHIDHINGDKLDNRWKNLRIVTPRENSQNQKKHRNGKLAGCSYHKENKKWLARYWLEDKLIHVGSFDTELEAHEAYMKAIHCDWCEKPLRSNADFANGVCLVCTDFTTEDLIDDELNCEYLDG